MPYTWVHEEFTLENAASTIHEVQASGTIKAVIVSVSDGTSYHLADYHAAADADKRFSVKWDPSENEVTIENVGLSFRGEAAMIALWMYTES